MGAAFEGALAGGVLAGVVASRSPPEMSPEMSPSLLKRRAPRCIAARDTATDLPLAVLKMSVAAAGTFGIGAASIGTASAVDVVV